MPAYRNPKVWSGLAACFAELIIVFLCLTILRSDLPAYWHDGTKSLATGLAVWIGAISALGALANFVSAFAAALDGTWNRAEGLPTTNK